VVTPGRFYDLLNRKAVTTATIRVLVLDEADQMLESRFREQIHLIMHMGWPATTQVALLSATMIKDIADVARSLLDNPVEILLPPDEVTLEGIKQYYVSFDSEDWKFDALCDIYAQLPINQAIIYCNKRQKAEWLGMKMKEAKFTLEVIHGEMTSDERKQKMDDFRQGKVRVLISTDLLARGIDVQQVSLVINFELPLDTANYIHRIGRAGRYGRKGVTINLICANEKKLKDQIEGYWATVMSELPSNLGELSL
jgi:superfamily II DNA/RNA helicase